MASGVWLQDFAVPEVTDTRMENVAGEAISFSHTPLTAVHPTWRELYLSRCAFIHSTPQSWKKKIKVRFNSYLKNTMCTLSSITIVIVNWLNEFPEWSSNFFPRSCHRYRLISSQDPTIHPITSNKPTFFRLVTSSWLSLITVTILEKSLRWYVLCY